MKALVLQAYNELVYTEVPDPAVRPDEVLVQVRACGICGSDVHGMDGSSGRRIPPIIMGHEAAGVIMQVGAEVTGWRVGERVTFDSTVYCGTCHFCRRGKINLCDNRRVLGVSCDEYRQHGAFAEYIVVPQRILYRLPDGLAFEEAAMVEALSIAFHAVGRTPVTLADTALVIGAGTIGLLVIQSLRLAGCGQIVAVDLDADRLEMAREFGADHGVLAKDDDVLAEILARTGERGADLAFEVVGLSTTLNTAVSALRKGGSLTIVGNLAPRADLPLQAAVTRELSLYGSCSSNGEYPACLEMIARGAVDVRRLISAVAPLAGGGDWFARLYKREPGLMKVVLVP
jgi:L-iditol 2-dehydrogenase